MIDRLPCRCAGACWPPAPVSRLAPCMPLNACPHPSPAHAPSHCMPSHSPQRITILHMRVCCRQQGHRLCYFSKACRGGHDSGHDGPLRCGAPLAPLAMRPYANACPCIPVPMHCPHCAMFILLQRSWAMQPPSNAMHSLSPEPLTTPCPCDCRGAGPGCPGKGPRPARCAQSRTKTSNCVHPRLHRWMQAFTAG